MRNPEIHNLEQQTITDSTTIKEIQPIQESAGKLLKTREDLEKIVEAPLLEACQQLWDKNIQTLSSSANYKNLKKYESFVNNVANITINFDTLSEENKAIAMTITEPFDDGRMKTTTISVSLNETSTIGEVKSSMREIVEKFKPQAMNWTPHFSLTELRKTYQDETITTKDDEALGLYYDEKTEMFFMSEECCRKYSESH